MLRERYYWKEDGCRKDPSTLVGRMKSRCQGTEKHRLFHCPEWCEARREITEAPRKWEQKARTSEKEWKWQRGIVTHPLSESQWNKGHFSMKKKSEKHKS